MVKTLKDFLLDIEKEYKFRIKVAKELDPKSMDLLEKYLIKYGIKQIKGPTKTPIQQAPLDFPKIRNVEIWIADVVLEYPTTPELLRQEIRALLGLSELEIIVRTDTDPQEQYTDIINKNEKPETRLNDPNYDKEPETRDPKELYGHDRNKDMVKLLNDDMKANPTYSKYDLKNGLPVDGAKSEFTKDQKTNFSDSTSNQDSPMSKIKRNKAWNR